MKHALSIFALALAPLALLGAVQFQYEHTDVSGVQFGNYWYKTTRQSGKTIRAQDIAFMTEVKNKFYYYYGLDSYVSGFSKTLPKAGDFEKLRGFLSDEYAATDGFMWLTDIPQSPGSDKWYEYWTEQDGRGSDLYGIVKERLKNGVLGYKRVKTAPPASVSVGSPVKASVLTAYYNLFNAPAVVTYNVPNAGNPFGDRHIHNENYINLHVAGYGFDTDHYTFEGYDPGYWQSDYTPDFCSWIYGKDTFYTNGVYTSQHELTPTYNSFDLELDTFATHSLKDQYRITGIGCFLALYAWKNRTYLVGGEVELKSTATCFVRQVTAFRSQGYDMKRHIDGTRQLLDRVPEPTPPSGGKLHDMQREGVAVIGIFWPCVYYEDIWLQPY